jgi:putative membrane protein
VNPVVKRSAVAVASILAIGSIGVGQSAVAADGTGVRVVNTETVQIYTSPSGEVLTKRVYEQLALSGEGSVDLLNPVETSGLRNLDGFLGVDVQDGLQAVSTDVDGTKNFRTVSDYQGTPPLSIAVEYLLDGEAIDPGDVVGKSGHLEVNYTITNETGQTQTISYDDGKGGTVTKDVTIPVPYVGSLDINLPATFRDVEAPAANMAGDGVGGTILSYTMTLFPPLSDGEARLSYAADITDGVVPRASVTALPVDPIASPTFATAANGYQGGSESGIELADGAGQIDSHLLEIRDGAADLLAGLIQLRDGADELSAGLNGEAAPGAGLIADGAGKLSDGGGAARAGSQKLTDGLALISGGLGQLADNTTGLPAAKAGIQQLQAGVDLILAGLGSASAPASLIGGLSDLATGLGQLEAGAGGLVDGLGLLTDPATGLPAAKGGVDQVKAGLDAATAVGGDLDQLVGGINALLPFCAGNPTCEGTIALLTSSVDASKTDLLTASAGLGQVSAGLASAITGLTAQIIPGAQQIETGLTSAKGGANQLKAGAVDLKAGVNQVSDGLDTLYVGVAKAVSGVLQLDDGAKDAWLGGNELTTGLGDLEDGAGALSLGADALRTGLLEAAAGSGLIADGLGEAADGAPKLVDGAQQLSDEGTKELVSKGEETAQSYGELYATMQAVSTRAQQESMIVGAPEGSIGLAAYSFEIEGENGEDQRNVLRAIVGFLILGAAGGVLAMRRRMA